MQALFALLALFLVGCILYGVYSGVRSVARGAQRLSGQPPSEEDTPAEAPSSPDSSPTERTFRELESLFALYRSGALSKEEFEQLKRHLLASIGTLTEPALTETKPET